MISAGEYSNPDLTQRMIATDRLIETGSGTIKAVADRIEKSMFAKKQSVEKWRLAAATVILTLMGIAISAFGLTDLISKGYGTICWGFLIVYVIPMLTIGVYMISRAGK